MGKYESGAEMREKVLRKHEIWCGIQGRDLELRFGSFARTDTMSFIEIPIESPDADLIHAHEWQHVFFKTDLWARATFVDRYTEKMVGQGLLTSPDSIKPFLHYFLNALDDLRVASLWGRIYPGTAREIEENWRERIENNHLLMKDISIYMMALGLGLRPPFKPPWVKYEEPLRDAALAVRGKGFPALLSIGRTVLDTIINDILKDMKDMPEGIGQIEVMRKLAKARGVIESMTNGARKGTLELDTNKLPESGEPLEVLRSTKRALAGLGELDPAEAQEVFEEGEAEVKRTLDSLSSRTSTRRNPDRALLQNLKNVEFVDLRREDVLDQQLLPSDRRIVERLRSEFKKLLQARTPRRTEEGTDLDVQAYLDWEFGGGPEIFEDRVRSRGFSAHIVLDMSGSMRRSWDTYARICKVLAKALKFPFSKFEVWGFSGGGRSIMGSDVTILRFKDPEKGYVGPKVDENAWGSTPLYEATLAATRNMDTHPSTDSRWLFLITDGAPTSSRNVSGSRQELMEAIGGLTAAARARGILVIGVVVGDHVSDSAAAEMFGPFWSRIHEDSVFQDLVHMVRNAFKMFLRGS